MLGAQEIEMPTQEVRLLILLLCFRSGRAVCYTIGSIANCSPIYRCEIAYSAVVRTVHILLLAWLA